MNHLMRFDELSLNLVSVGQTIGDDEKFVIFLKSLPEEYDMMVRIIEATCGVTLMGAKEMLRREYETLQKCDDKERTSKNIGRRVVGVVEASKKAHIIMWDNPTIAKV